MGDGQGFVKYSCKTGYERSDCVNVWDQMFYVTQGAIIVTPAKISDEFFNIDF